MQTLTSGRKMRRSGAMVVAAVGLLALASCMEELKKVEPPTK